MPAPLKLLALGVSAVAGGATVSLLSSEPPVSMISFLSVGQGDCTVIRSQGATLLVDAGPASDRFDAGDRIVAPKLREMGIRQIDLLLLTHPDLDHIGGLPGLASKIDIRQVGISTQFRGDVELAQKLEKARITSDRIIWIEGDVQLSYGNLQCVVRAPESIDPEENNEGSLFVKVRLGGPSAVLTGDAGEETEAVQAGRGDWSADLLKAGHHGSGTSTGAAWLQEVKPRAVIFSCGFENRFGHPAEAVLRRVKASGASILRTDRDGDLHFLAGPTGFVRVTNP